MTFSAAVREVPATTIENVYGSTIGVFFFPGMIKTIHLHINTYFTRNTYPSNRNDFSLHKHAPHSGYQNRLDRADHLCWAPLRDENAG